MRMWPSVLCSSLKREIRKLAQECGYEESTVAMAFVYFEKLVLQGKLNKQNRKLCAGACVLLAAKIGGDLKKHEVKHLIDVSLSLPIDSFSSLLCNYSYSTDVVYSTFLDFACLNNRHSYNGAFGVKIDLLLCIFGCFHVA